MIIWLNGAFGAGKTTVAASLVELVPGLVLFDTEQVGYMLKHVLDARRPVADFTEWRPWRSLVVATAQQLASYLDTDLVIPQSVLVRSRWDELMDDFESKGMDVRAFTLHVDEVEHQRRILDDRAEPDAQGWRLENAIGYRKALPWLTQCTTVIDTTTLTPNETAQSVLTALARRK
jgi:hypothetical protein